MHVCACEPMCEVCLDAVPDVKSLAAEQGGGGGSSGKATFMTY